MTINGKDRDICIVIDVLEFDVSTVVEKLHFRQTVLMKSSSETIFKQNRDHALHTAYTDEM